MIYRYSPFRPKLQYFEALQYVHINNFQIACFMYSYTKNVLPRFFSEYFKFNCDINMYNTRNARKFYIPFYRNSLSRSLVTYKGPIVWNNIPDTLKLCPTLSSFRRKYKSYLISK